MRYICCVECFNSKTLCNSVTYSNGKLFKTLDGNSTLHPTCASTPLTLGQWYLLGAVPLLRESEEILRPEG